MFASVHLKKEESQFAFKISYFEIYKEVVRDLLRVEEDARSHELHICDDELGNTGM